MREVLEFVFEDAWHFIGVCVLMMIVAQWKPVEVNILSGFVKREDEDEG